MKCSGHTVSAAALVVSTLLVFGGCTTVRQQTYEGHNPDHVWTAMQVVAESPSYDDWHLVENEIAVQPGERRIEVYRRLRRSLYDPDLVKPQQQHREFRLSFALEATDPPTVVVRNRDCNIPSRVWTEADRYFADVADILGPPPAAPRDDADMPPSPDEDAPDDEAPDDADDANGGQGEGPPVDIDSP